MAKKVQNKEGTPEEDESKIIEVPEHELKRAASHSRRHAKNTHQEVHNSKKKLHQSRRVIFILGAVIGLLLAVFFSTSPENLLLKDAEGLVSFDGLSDFFQDWKDVFPASLQSMISDIDVQDPEKLHGSAESFSVGRRMIREHQLSSKHNVVMVPGVISTGIESWGLGNSTECPSINHFRKRLWGSFYMLRTMILDKTCWLKHIMLDPETGLDPPNVKLRAAQGFEAADFFIAGYWIWNKIFQNLAVIGYCPNSMSSAAYDWRLAYLDLERRDAYFSKLKNSIELKFQSSGEKTTLIGHSMGSQVIFYFLKWVEASGERYGNGGPQWCEKYLDSVIDISGSSLGTPKTLTALLSGEMKDTVQLNALAVYGLEKFFSRRERVDMLRTFGGVPSMIPKGGAAIWGNLTHAPDDPSNTLMTHNSNHSVNDTLLAGTHKESFGRFMKINSAKGDKNLTVDEVIDYMLDNSPSWFSDRVRDQYSFGLAKTKQELQKNNHDHSKWSNPLEAALPNAPSMKYYCFYGVGKATERAYTYHDAETGSNLNITIDSESSDPVYFGDGDGTVSLLTHTVCHLWKQGDKSRYNPGNIPVTIVEIKDEPDRFDIRGGAKTADHVDILGSAELNELVLKVVSGRGDLIQDRYISDLNRIVSTLDI